MNIQVFFSDVDNRQQRSETLTSDDKFNSQSTRYKTDSWQPRNLFGFFLIAFGWTWFWWALLIFDVLNMPAGVGTPDVDLSSAGPIILIIVLSPFGPTIAGFVVTARTKGKVGLKRLWKHFWNRNLTGKWLLVIMLFFPVRNMILRYSAQTFAVVSHQPFEWLDQPWMGSSCKCPIPGICRPDLLRFGSDRRVDVWAEETDAG